MFCIPLCAEPHEGVDVLRKFQGKTEPVVKGRSKVSVTTLMAAMAAEVASVVGERCIIIWVWLFCIFPYDDPVVAILLIRLLRVYLIILRWPVFLVDDFEFVVAGTESSA